MYTHRLISMAWESRLGSTLRAAAASGPHPDRVFGDTAPLLATRGGRLRAWAELPAPWMRATQTDKDHLIHDAAQNQQALQYCGS